MPRTTDTRQRMVRSAARLLRRQGYAATGWRQVVADSATPWGSQAHHFPGGKEQLAAEALTLSGASYERMLRAALAGAHPAAARRAWAGAAARARVSGDGADACPVATVALETAHTSDTLAAACGSALAAWRTVLVQSIASRGTAPPEPGALATLSPARRDTEPLRTVGRELATVLTARLG